MFAIHCLLRGKTPEPGKRFYLRENNEPSVCVQSLLDNGLNSTEVEAYLKFKLHGVVCWKALITWRFPETSRKAYKNVMTFDKLPQHISASDIIASTSIFSSYIYVTDFHVTNAFMWFEPCDWNDLIGTLTFQRSATKCVTVSPDPSSSKRRGWLASLGCRHVHIYVYQYTAYRYNISYHHCCTAPYMYNCTCTVQFQSTRHSVDLSDNVLHDFLFPNH